MPGAASDRRGGLLSLIGGAGPVGVLGQPRRRASTYAVDGTLTTYNTNTVAGAASGGPQAFARVLTGFNYHGPDGQIVGDHDFGTISVVGRAPLVLDYEISDKAVYSDGKPVTCDDMVLAWASQSGRFPGFDAANRAGYSDIAICRLRAGAEEGAGVLRPGPRVRRLRPAVRRDVDDAVARHRRRTRHRRHDRASLNNDGPTVERIAQVWNTTWNLTPADLDMKRFPSSGPYKLESVTEDGAVVLVANDKWWGAKPVTDKIDRVAAGRRRPGPPQQGAYDVVDVADWVVGYAEPARRLCPDRLAVGRHRAADLRPAGTDGRARPRAGRWRCARRAM